MLRPRRGRAAPPQHGRDPALPQPHLTPLRREKFRPRRVRMDNGQLLHHRTRGSKRVGGTPPRAKTACHGRREHDRRALPRAGALRAGRGVRGALPRISARVPIRHRAAPRRAVPLPRRPPRRADPQCRCGLPRDGVCRRQRRIRPRARSFIRRAAAVRGARPRKSPRQRRHDRRGAARRPRRRIPAHGQRVARGLPAPYRVSEPPRGRGGAHIRAQARQKSPRRGASRRVLPLPRAKAVTRARVYRGESAADAVHLAVARVPRGQRGGGNSPAAAGVRAGEGAYRLRPAAAAPRAADAADGRGARGAARGAEHLRCVGAADRRRERACRGGGA